MEKADVIDPVNQQAREQVSGTPESLRDANKQIIADILRPAPVDIDTNTSPIKCEGQNITNEKNSPHVIEEEKGNIPYIPYIPIPKNLETWRDYPLVVRFMPKVSYEALEKTIITATVFTIFASGLVGGVSLGIKSTVRVAEWNDAILGLLLSQTYLFTMKLFFAIEMLGLSLLQYLFSLKVGKYSKIVLKEKSGTIEYHIERNLTDMQILNKEMTDLKGDKARLQERIIEKKSQLKDDIVKSVGELIKELYASGKVKNFNKIVLDSYLLANDETFHALEEALKEHVPGEYMTDMGKRKQSPLKQFALKILGIKIGMIRKYASRDTLYQKALASIFCSENIIGIALSTIILYLYGAIPYIGGSKKDLRYTRGIAINLPPKNKEDMLV